LNKGRTVVEINRWRRLPRAVEVEIPTAKDMRRFKEDFMCPFKQYRCEDL